jgi:hypothetical protein
MATLSQRAMLPKFHSAAPVPNPRCSPRLLLVAPPLLLAALPFLVTAPGAAFPTHRVGAPPGCSPHRGTLFLLTVPGCLPSCSPCWGTIGLLTRSRCQRFGSACLPRQGVALPPHRVTPFLLAFRLQFSGHPSCSPSTACEAPICILPILDNINEKINGKSTLHANMVRISKSFYSGSLHGSMSLTSDGG